MRWATSFFFFKYNACLHVRVLLKEWWLRPLILACENVDSHDIACVFNSHRWTETQHCCSVTIWTIWRSYCYDFSLIVCLNHKIPKGQLSGLLICLSYLTSFDVFTDTSGVSLFTFTLFLVFVGCEILVSFSKAHSHYVGNNSKYIVLYHPCIYFSSSTEISKSHVMFFLAKSRSSL